jgi:hypothetical protein
MIDQSKPGHLFYEPALIIFEKIFISKQGLVENWGYIWGYPEIYHI